MSALFTGLKSSLDFHKYFPLHGDPRTPAHVTRTTHAPCCASGSGLVCSNGPRTPTSTSRKRFDVHVSIMFRVERLNLLGT